MTIPRTERLVAERAPSDVRPFTWEKTGRPMLRWSTARSSSSLAP